MTTEERLARIEAQLNRLLELNGWTTPDTYWDQMKSYCCYSDKEQLFDFYYYDSVKSRLTASQHQLRLNSGIDRPIDDVTSIMETCLATIGIAEKPIHVTRWYANEKQELWFYYADLETVEDSSK